jgi:hypothetical protein
VNATFVLDDWRDVGRIIGLLNRFGCSLERLEVQRGTDGFRTIVHYASTTGDTSTDLVYRLNGQINRVINDAKEMQA